MNFDPTELGDACKHTFDPRTLERARSYFNMGNVIAMEWHGERGVLEGTVAGNFQSSYRVEVEIMHERTGITIDAECNCPVSYNCKHGAAMVLRLISDIEEAQRTQNALELWQETLHKYHPRAQPRAASDQTSCLVYELSSQHNRDGVRLNLDISTARKLKRGGLGKRSRLSSYDYINNANSAIQDDTDKEIMQLVNAARSQYLHSTVIALEGEIGGLLLDRIIKTSRGYLRQEGHPLVPGKPLKPSFRWQPTEGKLKLHCDLPGLDDSWICCPTDDAYYIDTNKLTCGVIETSLSGQLLGALRLMPPVLEGEAKTLAREILVDQDLAEIPLPVELEIHRIQDCLPTPRLTLIGLNGTDAGTAPASYFAKLESVYQNHVLQHYLVKQDPKVIILDADSETLVFRDVEAETKQADTLQKKSFVAVPFGPEYCVFPEGRGVNQYVAWQRFLDQDAADLEQEGWEIIIDPSFTLSFVEPDSFDLNATEQGNGWFDVSMEIEIEGKKQSLLPLLIDWLESQTGDVEKQLAEGGDTWVRYDDESFVRLPVDVLKPVLSTLVELLDRTRSENDAITLSRHNAPLLLDLHDKLNAEGVSLGKWQLPDTLRSLAERLHDFSGIEPVPVPAELTAELRDYQKQGLDWLQFLRSCGFGGVLADDMGLGKTVQVLANLLVEKQQGRLTKPCLIVVPTSLISNWRREAERFTPDLSLLVVHGPDRQNVFSRIDQHDLVITTYSLLPRDSEELMTHQFYYVVLDESQWIKNAKTRAARVAGSLVADYRLCVTGTPLENNLGEVWSQFNFLMPGFLGNQEAFNKRFRNPIERRGEEIKSAGLAARLSPFILRRTKQQVASELPDKVEMESLVSFEPQQAVLYETVRATMEQRVRDVLKRRGLAQSHITILDALLKMRQVCCDPRLVKLEQAAGVEQSAKLDHLMELVPEMVAEGRKILLFSQFTSMLALIEPELERQGISYSKLTGQTRDRETEINAFQEGDSQVFLVSLKAGGVGLNLTAADTVILYDPWWNPAVERQAIDRAHRIGQDKTVFVYRLIVEDSIEQKILAMQASKQQLADNLVGADGKVVKALDADDILGLFRE